MTTIRRFLTNVAPRVLGDSPYGTKTDPNAPRTKTRIPGPMNRGETTTTEMSLVSMLVLWSTKATIIIGKGPSTEYDDHETTVL